MEKIDKFVLDSIYKAGGAINWSGVYPISEEFEKFLCDGLSTGCTKLIEEH